MDVMIEAKCKVCGRDLSSDKAACCCSSCHCGLNTRTPALLAGIAGLCSLPFLLRIVHILPLPCARRLYDSELCAPTVLLCASAAPQERALLGLRGDIPIPEDPAEYEEAPLGEEEAVALRLL